MLLQAVCIIAFLRKLRFRALSHVGFWVVVFSFIYHGGTEIVQALFPGYNDYQNYISDVFVDEWVLWVSCAMVLFTVGYLWKIKIRIVPDSMQRMRMALRNSGLLNWAVIVGLAGVALTLQVARAVIGLERLGYWAGGGLDQFAAPFVSFSLVLAIIRTEGRMFTVLLAITAAIFLLTGSRSTVVYPVLAVVGTAMRYNLRINAAKLVPLAAFLVSAIFLLSITRGRYGRFTDDDSVSQRTEAIIESASSSNENTDDGAAEWVKKDTVYRFDGNSFGAMITDRHEVGYNVAGFEGVYSTLRYMVPSFLYRDKQNLESHDLNEEAYMVWHYNFDYGMDWTPTVWSAILGYIGPLGMLFFGFLYGMMWASADNRLNATYSPVALAAGIWLMLIPLSMEQGAAGVVFVLRGLPLIAIILAVIKKFGQEHHEQAAAFTFAAPSTTAR